MTSLAKNILGFSFLSVEKQDTFSAGLENEANNRLPFSTSQRRESTNTTATSPSAHQWRFGLDDRDSHRPRKKQQMWLSTLGGKKYLKCHFRVRTESQGSSWLPVSQALSPLTLKVSRQNMPLVQETKPDHLFSYYTWLWRGWRSGRGTFFFQGLGHWWVSSWENRLLKVSYGNSVCFWALLGVVVRP